MYSCRCSSDRSKDKCLIPIKNRDRLWGRSPDVVNIKEKSAEVIVVSGNEPMEGLEVSQTDEGPKVKLIEML